MAHKTFISYKYNESQNLRDDIIKAMGDNATFYQGETADSPDLTEVSVIKDKTFQRRIYTFPKSIYARLSIINGEGKEIDYNLLECLKIYKAIDVQLPLSLDLDVDKEES